MHPVPDASSPPSLHGPNLFLKFTGSHIYLSRRLDLIKYIELYTPSEL